jgi:hypothetical protein
VGQNGVRLVEALVLAEQPRQVEARSHDARIERDGPVIASLCLAAPALLVQYDAEVVVRPGVIRLEFERTAIRVLRLGQIVPRNRA